MGTRGENPDGTDKELDGTLEKAEPTTGAENDTQKPKVEQQRMETRERATDSLWHMGIED